MKIRIASPFVFFKSLKDCLLGKEFYNTNKYAFLRGIEEYGGYDVTAMHSYFTKNQITIFEKRLFQIATWLLVLTFFWLFPILMDLTEQAYFYILFSFYWYLLYLFPFFLRIQRLLFVFAIYFFAFWNGLFSFYLSIIPSIFGFDEIVFDGRIFMGSELFYRFLDLPFDVLWFVFIALMIPLTILTLVSYRRISFALFFVLITTITFWVCQEIIMKGYSSELFDYHRIGGKEVKLGDIKGYEKELMRITAETTAANTSYSYVSQYIKPTAVYYYDKLHKKENKCVRDFFIKKTIWQKRIDYSPPIILKEALDLNFWLPIDYISYKVQSIGMLHCDFASKIQLYPDGIKSIDNSKSTRYPTNAERLQKLTYQRSPGEFCTSYYDYVVKKAREECNK